MSARSAFAMKVEEFSLSVILLLCLSFLLFISVSECCTGQGLDIYAKFQKESSIFTITTIMRPISSVLIVHLPKGMTLILGYFMETLWTPSFKTTTHIMKHFSLTLLSAVIVLFWLLALSICVVLFFRLMRMLEALVITNVLQAMYHALHQLGVIPYTNQKIPFEFDLLVIIRMHLN